MCIRDRIAHVAVTTRNIVHSAANVLTVSKGQLRPVLVEHMELSVDVVLYQQQDFLGHFLAIAVDQFDAVIVVGIMAVSYTHLDVYKRQPIDRSFYRSRQRLPDGKTPLWYP